MTVDINRNVGNIEAGGNGSDGDIVLKDGEGRGRIHMDAEHADPYPFGSNGDDVRVFIDGKNGRARLGGNGTAGRLRVRNADGSMDSTISQYGVYGRWVTGHYGWFTGFDDRYASIQMYQPTNLANGNSLGSDGYTVDLSSDGTLSLGDGEMNGIVALHGDRNMTRVFIDGGDGSPLRTTPHMDLLRVGIDGGAADLWVGGGAFKSGPSRGAGGRDGTVRVKDRDGESSVELDGASGSVVLRSPSGNRFRVSVDDDGHLETSPV
jgi:hypothetical protein